jgi:hypothetical protein
MTHDEVERALRRIEGTDDLLERTLLLAALVSTAFRERGYDLVVVGGSAIEFYTEGAYMSGDVDFCRMAAEPIPPRVAQGIMGELSGSGGLRSWKVAGMFVDLLGQLETAPDTSPRVLSTPLGDVKVASPESLLVERVLVSVYPQPDAEAVVCAKKLMAACLSGSTAVDWDVVERLAADPRYAVLDGLREMRREVEHELEAH